MKLLGTSRKILKEVLSLPTAPFHEHKVIGYVTRFCLRNGFQLRQDEAGNIFLRYRRGRARQAVTFVAHMDHPGFEVLRVKGHFAKIGLLGGVRPDYFERARVVVSTSSGLLKGKVIRKLRKKWMGKPVFMVRLLGRILPSRGDFGYYDLPRVRFRGDKVYTKSADNLAGTALLLDIMRRLKEKGGASDVRVLLTRAEEVGFIGCIRVAEEGGISERVPVIVLETSDAKAGAVRLGGGPVIRVGDKQSGFSPEVDAWLQMIAGGMAKKMRGFKYQRALLSGGRCEASPLVLKGHTVGGVAFPLGNYHNNGPKTYEPEFISASDYRMALEFFSAIAKAPPLRVAFRAKKKELWRNYEKWRRYLFT